MKAYLVTDLAFAGRSAETYKLLWPLYESTTVNGAPAYILDHGKRVKLPGLASNNTSKIVQGELSVRAIRNYQACFENDKQTGRYFRPLKYKDSKHQSITSKTYQPIGKNTVSQFPRTIATILKLPEASEYTGHSWRRTSITIMADAGLSIPQIRSVSGHKSSKVLEGYVEASTAMKEITSGALALGAIGNSSSKSSASSTALNHSGVASHQKRSLPTTQTPTISFTISNSNFSGNSSIFSGLHQTLTNLRSFSRNNLNESSSNTPPVPEEDDDSDYSSFKIARRSVD